MSPAEPTPDMNLLVAEEELILEATEAVVRLLERDQLSRQELATRLEKSKGFVSQLLSGHRNMTLRTLADMGHVLGYRFRVVAQPVTRSYAQDREARTAVLGPDRLSVLEGGQPPRVRGRSVERAGNEVHRVSVRDWRRSLEERRAHDRSQIGPDSHEWALNA